MIEGLANRDWRARARAVDEAVAFVRTAPPASADAIVDRLVDALGADDDAGLRNAAHDVLVRVAPIGLERMLGAIEGATTDVRVLLAPPIGESGDPRAVPALATLAADDDGNVAAAAVMGLGRLRRREALEPLLEVLRGGDAWLAFPAVDALGALGDERAVAPLAARLEDVGLRTAVLDALVRIGTRDAARALAQCALRRDGVDVVALDALVRLAHEPWLGEAPSPFRSAAVGALRAEASGAHVDALVDAASADPPSDSALEALGWTGARAAVEPLVAAATRHSSASAAGAGLATLLEATARRAEIVESARSRDGANGLALARAIGDAAPLEAALLVLPFLDDDEFAADAHQLLAEAAEHADATRAAGADVRQLVAAIPSAPPACRPVLGRLARRVAPVGDATVPRAWLASPDADLRVAAAELVAAWSGVDTAVREAVRTAARDGARTRALEALEVARDAELLDLAIESVDDPDPSARRVAVEALAGADDDRARDALRAASVDPHDGIAAAALAALASSSADAARDRLRSAAVSARPLVRCVAGVWLASSDDETGRAMAARLATDDHEAEVRRAAVVAFASRPSNEARGVAAAALEDRDRSVRAAAARLAAALGDGTLADRVRTLAELDEAVDVRGEALVALGSLDVDAALGRASRALADRALAPFAARLLELVARADPSRLRTFRDVEASPRAALVAEAVLDGMGR